MGELILFIILIIIALTVILDALFRDSDNAKLLDNIKNFEKNETSRSNTNGKRETVSKR
tara:strand:- start:597 stop:773 length:177 start_codon:yes stop_codon:yes gene_type:complete